MRDTQFPEILAERSYGASLLPIHQKHFRELGERRDGCSAVLRVAVAALS